MENVSYSAFRIGPAAVEDVSSVAPLVYSAAPLYNDYLFDYGEKKAISFLSHAFLYDKGIFARSHVRVLRTEGCVAATIASFPTNKLFSLVLGNFMAIFSFYGFLGGIIVSLRTIKVGLSYEPWPKRSLYIANLGTAEPFRGKGFAGRLYEDRHAEGRAQNLLKAVIDVAHDNHSSKRVLEKLGYSLPLRAKTSKKTAQIRMEKIL